MKLFSAARIREIDALTIAYKDFEKSIDIMESAARGITQSIQELYPNKETSFAFFVGLGNNGGDALAVARLLHQEDYDIAVYCYEDEKGGNADRTLNLQHLKADTSIVSIRKVADLQQYQPCDVILDGLFGSGLDRPLCDIPAAIVDFMNKQRAAKIAIDIPSGLMSEDNTHNLGTIFEADYTITLEFPKLSLLFPENLPYVGEVICTPIGLSRQAIEETPTPYYYLTPKNISPLIHARQKFDHKGVFGHALLIAGANGMAGASILAGKATLRSGAGLLTISIPQKNKDIIQIALPEAMVLCDQNEDYFTSPVDSKIYHSLAIGPGLQKNRATAQAFIKQLRYCSSPVIVDADGINLLAEQSEAVAYLPKGSILTPHIGEFNRLIGKYKHHYERLTKAADWCKRHKVYMVLKGAYSTIITPERHYFFNSTGNPGMATGGSGDVLTGILLGLLTQGYSPLESCKIGVFVHGLAGDLAVKEKGEIALIASDIIDYLPQAWMKIAQKV